MKSPSWAAEAVNRQVEMAHTFRHRGRVEMVRPHPVAFLLIVIIATLVSPPRSSAQDDFGDDVDGLTLTAISATRTRLNWEPVQVVECRTSVTYSVFRGTTEDFTPSLKNRIASGLRNTSYVSTEPVPGKDYYYYVKAVTGDAPECVLHSGTILAYPLDLGESFTVSLDDGFGTCKAISVSEITCEKPLPEFHAFIAQQAGHEYLLGCRSADYDGGNWNCANLPSRVYHVGVHSRTVTVWDSGMAEMSAKTGKALWHITPVFSVLARLK